MKYKITYHMMPWEVDYALLSFIQFKKSKYYLHLDEEDEIIFDIELNLSKKLFNWKKTKLPKQHFIDKYNQILKLLEEDYNTSGRIYDGPKLRGHLQHQREAIKPDIDFYINVCPDIYFSEHLLSLMIAVSKQIPNEYFVLTPEIYKMWDQTWDEITNAEYLSVPYDDWNKGDIFDVRANMKNQVDYVTGEVGVTPEATQRSKWAGWFDLYNKEMYENLVRIHDDWTGYGPWDWYSLMMTEFAQSKGVDFQQYVLRGQTIFEYPVGPLLDGGLTKMYKDLLHVNDVPNQREIFEAKMQEYLNKDIKTLQEKKIL